MSSIFKINTKSHTDQPMFFGDRVDIQRFDVLKYKHVEQLNRDHISCFWVPEEIDLSRDATDFKGLDEVGAHIFSANLKRQIVLDSIQGRGPALTLLRVCSLPELEGFINTWSFFEGSIHSRSYTHIIRNVYSDPSEVFDTMKNVEEVIGFAEDISKYYDDFISYTNDVERLDYSDKRTKYEHMKKLWLLLTAINALEGIRFYVSFACSWAFAENKLMMGNADIIKLICRDENIHLGFTQWALKTLKNENEDYIKIAEECEEECRFIYETAIKQEKEWAEYLFKGGSIIGLNTEILSNYVEWLGTKRMRAVGLKRDCEIKSNPLPWTTKWIGNGDDKETANQAAPQEKEITDYLVGAINDNVDDSMFSNFKLD